MIKQLLPAAGLLVACKQDKPAATSDNAGGSAIPQSAKGSSAGSGPGAGSTTGSAGGSGSAGTLDVKTVGSDAPE